jgi:hypothetical protein
MSSARSLVERLRLRYPQAAALVERWADAPIASYAAALWSALDAPAQRPLEPRLVDALRGELRRTYGDDPRIDAALGALESDRVLGTTAHVAPAYGPVFLAADLLLSLAAPGDAPALVAVWTALPFNNKSWPGCVTFNGDAAALVRPRTGTWRRLHQSRSTRAARGDDALRLSLVSARDQRHLVYRHPLPTTLERALLELQPDAAALLGPADGSTFASWALRSCARIQGAILERPPLAFDLNRALAVYIEGVLEDSYHPITRVLLDRRARDELRRLFPEEPWFLGRTRSAKGERLAALVPVDDALVGLGRPLSLTAAALTPALERGEICPGLLLSYAALVGLNDLRCVGGLRQSVYLPAMADRWRRLGWGVAAATDDRPNLLLGRLVDDAGRPAHAVDLALEGRTAAPLAPADAPMSRLWGPLAELLAA